MPIDSKRPDYEKTLAKWKKTRDVIDSEVKCYIRIVDPNDPIRSEDYKTFAKLTNFTARTKFGLIGSVFSKPVTFTLPDSIAYMAKDVDGCGTTLERTCRKAVGEVLTTGRFCILVDYGMGQDGKNRAFFKFLRAEDVINWKPEMINGILQQRFIVSCQHVQKTYPIDPYEWICEKEYNEFSLDADGEYTYKEYDEKGQLILSSVRYPKDSKGRPWNTIPFQFIGSEDNDSKIDFIPMHDLADLNIGHLNNSADYEESVFFSGQATLFLNTDMTAEEMKAANPNGIVLGSRKGYNLGIDGKVQLLQANPNQLSDEAMKRKEEQAIMLGARLITQSADRETADAARIRHSSEVSMLHQIVQNVEEGITKCLRWAEKFADPDYSDELGGTSELEINKVFFDKDVDSQAIIAQMQLLEHNVIDENDVRQYLKRNGYILDGDRNNNE